MAQVDRLDASGATIGPSDVYSMATLLVSELTYLHMQVDDFEPPIRTYYPGSKLPSHVYQRVGILEAQLTELEKRVGLTPDWLQDRR